ncbi:hypothetical protein K443DRAFT_683726 [Laccaria amethystina LaAM-08-1]|uniref:Uncharacterized protein n=1 Tax=Laccaria amethystina LaAM-08-1 TaxID=1095629 RepID=A0A0C9WJC6_9AGAR|nr:hypothetical protein K443DRAFT_683726 [Laccaria amethystina LaAM-08-1]
MKEGTYRKPQRQDGRICSHNCYKPTPSPFVVDLSFHWKDGWCGDRVSKSSADQNYGDETFAGNEDTDMALLAEGDKCYDRKSS